MTIWPEEIRTKLEKIIETYKEASLGIQNFDLDEFLLRWILIPTVPVIGNASSKCSSACIENGYVDFRYVPPDRRSGNSHSKCYCLTEDEAKVKRRIPKGMRIDDWR